MPTDLKILTANERAEFAVFLASLAPDEWEAPTLCDGWRVRELVAHAISYETIGLGELVALAVRSRMRPDRMNAAGVAALAGRTPAELVALMHANLRPTGLTTAFGSRVGLTDVLIHHQDVRRALGRPRTIPAKRMRVVLDFTCIAPPIGAPPRIRGLALAAADLAWSTGSGPLVVGPAEAVLMAMAGRRAALDELAGDGLPILTARLAA